MLYYSLVVNSNLSISSSFNFLSKGWLIQMLGMFEEYEYTNIVDSRDYFEPFRATY